MIPHGTDLSVLEKSLCDEFEAWCKTNGVDWQSADEVLTGLLDQEPRNEAHIAYVEDFIVRWDAWAEADREAYRREKEWADNGFNSDPQLNRG